MPGAKKGWAGFPNGHFFGRVSRFAAIWNWPLGPNKPNWIRAFGNCWSAWDSQNTATDVPIDSVWANNNVCQRFGLRLAIHKSFWQTIAEDLAENLEDQTHGAVTLIGHVDVVVHALLDESMAESKVLIHVQLGEVRLVVRVFRQAERLDKLLHFRAHQESHVVALKLLQGHQEPRDEVLL